MLTPDSEEFRRLSEQYAEALEAFRTIERQAATLTMMGATSELGRFLDQFIEMSLAAAAEAEEKGMADLPEWFDELTTAARALRQTVTDSGDTSH